MIERKTEVEGKKAVIAFFDSPAEFADASRDAGCPVTSSKKNEWFGYESLSSAYRKARTGDDALVADAQSILNEINAAGLDVSRTEYAPSIAGQFPVVPDFLTGHPQCMRRRVSNSSDRSPVRIYVDNTSSGGISAKMLHKRGTALLAFAMALSAERPVELYTIAALDGGGRSGYAGAAIRIPSAPLELATACYALTNQGFVRGLGYDYLMKTHGSCGGWGWGIYPNGADPKCEYRRLSRLAYGMTDDDVFVSAIMLHDDLLRQPVQWVNRMLDHYRNREE